MKVLLTDGDQRSTLAAARALGAAGMEVYVAETSAPSLASRSRYCREALVYPSPYVDEAGFVRTIAAAGSRLGLGLVIPMTDITSAVLAEHRESLVRTVPIAVMDAETFWRASDKNALHRLATRLGVPHPTVHYIERPQEFDQIRDVSFPCVVKPARSRLRTPGGWIGTSVRVARSREELERWFATIPELQYPCMLQRQIDGEGSGVFALCDHGEPRALFAHRRLRERPPSGGVSVLREAVPVDPSAGEYARRLLKELRWHGVAMVEFRKERSSGTPFLMEINGRFWGSLQLSIDAGVNFPVSLVRLWKGDAVPAAIRYRVGVRSRWLFGDLDHLLIRLRANGATPPDAPPIGRLLFDFCRFFRRDTRFEVESLRDPGPSLHEIHYYFRHLLRSARARIADDRAAKVSTELRAFIGRRRRSAQHAIERLLHPRRRRRALARVRSLKPERILVMCHGNICRSPYAAARLEVLLRNAGKASVRSAGFIHPGRPSPDNARAAAERRGVDLGLHRSRVVAPDDLRDSDLVLVMDEVQRQNLIVNFGAPDDRIVLLGDLDPEAIETRTIPDPEGCALEVFEACYDRLARCVDSLALQIQPRHQ